MSAESNPVVNEDLARAAEKMKTVSKTSFMIAYERGLESSRPDALFNDPWAASLDVAAGGPGAELSKAMKTQPFACNVDQSWPEYHQQWVAVRTRFIDDRLTSLIGKVDAGETLQVICLGAGMDMRPYRLPSELISRLSLYLEVDSAEVTAAKPELLSALSSISCPCRLVNIACDLASDSLFETLASEGGWDASKATIWIAEGLLMYLPFPVQRKLLSGIASRCAGVAGSAAIVNCLLPVGDSREPAEMLGEEEVRELLTTGGFGEVELLRFGDEGLSYGRYPEGLEPCPSFSFFVGEN